VLQGARRGGLALRPQPSRQREVKLPSRASGTGAKLSPMTSEPTRQPAIAHLNPEALKSVLAALLATAQRLAPKHPEDLLHDALLRLIEADSQGKLPAFSSDSGFLAYARTTLRNLSVTQARSISAHIPNLESPDQTEAPCGKLSPVEHGTVLESNLPPRARLSIVLRNRLGCSHDVVARVLGFPTREASQNFYSRSVSRLRIDSEPKGALEALPKPTPTRARPCPTAQTNPTPPC